MTELKIARLVVAAPLVALGTLLLFPLQPLQLFLQLLVLDLQLELILHDCAQADAAAEDGLPTSRGQIAIESADELIKARSAVPADKRQTDAAAYGVTQQMPVQLPQDRRVS